MILTGIDFDIDEKKGYAEIEYRGCEYIYTYSYTIVHTEDEFYLVFHSEKLFLEDAEIEFVLNKTLLRDIVEESIFASVPFLGYLKMNKNERIG